MKTIKALCCATLALVSFGALADAANVLIMFSTPGPDTYADGATVLDGERYALVWSADGKFDGIKTDGTAVDKNDLVIYIAGLAEGGRCPLTMFEIDSASPKAKREGVYGVYLLDTRVADKKSVAATAANGLPEIVNGAISTQDYTAAAAMASVEKTTGEGASQWCETEIAVDATSPDYKPLKITAFEVEGAQVTISVEGMLPNVPYNIKMGATPNNLKSYALKTPQTGTAGKAKVVLPVNEAKFFQAVREPLKK